MATYRPTFDGQNHDAHIVSHMLFSASPIAAQTPSIIMALQKHVTEHVKIKSEEMAMMQFMQQSQGQPPTDDQMLEIEMIIAQNISQELQNVRQLSMQIAGQGQPQQPQGPDPLIALKEREIGIKEQEAMADIQEGQAKLDLERQKMMERSRQFDDRLQSQEQMTAQRLDAQAERELLRLRANRGNQSWEQ